MFSLGGGGDWGGGGSKKAKTRNLNNVRDVFIEN